MRKGTTRLGLTLLAVAIAAGPALAEDRPRSAREIVAAHCTACHEVPGYRARHERADINAPSFQSIADQPEVYTRERLQAFLRRPHYPMTSFVLSPADIDGLISYIYSLRKD